MPEVFAPTVCLSILRTVTQKDQQYEPFWTLDSVRKYSNMWVLYISQQYLWSCNAGKDPARIHDSALAQSGKHIATVLLKIVQNDKISQNSKSQIQGFHHMQQLRYKDRTLPCVQSEVESISISLLVVDFFQCF